MYGSDPNRIATYARKLTEIQIPGMHYNTAPLAPGGRTDIIGAAEGLVPGPEGTTPGTVYGTTYTPGVPVGTSGGALPYSTTGPGASAENVWEIGVAESYCQYPDQIMPFDITIMGMNEFGQMSVARVYGVELLNMGMSLSTDDMDISQTYTYIAQAFVDFQPIYWDRNAGMELNRFLTFGRTGALSVGGLPGEESVPWAPFVEG